MQPVSEVLADWGGRNDHWLSTSALPLWWSLGADHQLGGFHELLDGNGAAVPAPRRARVQARQVFVFATAAAGGWSGPGREAAMHGMTWFRRHYLRDDGFFRSEVEADGRVTDETARL